jgi:protease secretion system outer membrane protein
LFRKKNLLSIILLCISSFSLAGVNNNLDHPLITGYYSSLNFDPDYQTVLLDREVAKENIALARAGLLPIVSANYNRTNNTTDQKTTNAFGDTTNQFFNYPSTSTSLTLQQPLIRAKSWFAYFQSISQDDGAKLKLANGLQNLVMRVIQYYLDVNQFNHQLFLQEINIKKYEQWTNQNNKLMKAGLITIPQQEEVRTRLLLEAENLSEIKNNLKKAKLNYQNSTGIDLNTIFPINSNNFKFFYSKYPTLDNYLIEVEKLNIDLLVKKRDVQNADYEVKKFLSDHLPTVSLVLSNSYSSSGQDLSIGRELRTNSIGIQATLPIFTGGQTQSHVRQSTLTREKIKSELNSLERKIKIDASTDYVALSNAINKIDALKNQVKSAELKFNGLKKGRNAGISTDLDIISSEYELENLKFELTKMIGTATILYVKLHMYVGDLGDEMLISLASIKSNKN